VSVSLKSTSLLGERGVSFRGCYHVSISSATTRCGKTTRALEISSATGAVRLCPDEWIVALGISLVDYEFRPRFEAQMLRHGEDLLRAGLGVIVEFGSWSRTERDAIRQIAVRAGVAAELHFLDAPLDELVRRVRKRGGPDASVLADKVLLETRAGSNAPRRTSGHCLTSTSVRTTCLTELLAAEAATPCGGAVVADFFGQRAPPRGPTSWARGAAPASLCKGTQRIARRGRPVSEADTRRALRRIAQRRAALDRVASGR